MGEKDERGKALFSNVESVWVSFCKISIFLPIRQIQIGRSILQDGRHTVITNSIFYKTSKMPMRCTEHQDAFIRVVYLAGDKDERGKALFANVERGVGIFLQNCHSFLPIGQI